MLCFKVEINNDSVCLAGVGHSGVLTAVLSWVADHQQALAPEERPPVVLRVGGLSGGGKGTAQFVDWTNRDLNTGDEIRITIIDAIECDKPTTTSLRRDLTDRTTCSFCAKKGSEVEEMVTGPGVYICNECIARFAESMSDRGEANS